MTPDTENLAARIDRDRRERERELLALLLLLFWQARQHVYAAVRVNADPFRAAADVLMGAPHAGPGLAPRLAAQLALSERAGYRRTLLVLPGDGQPPAVPYAATQQAQAITGQAIQTLYRRMAVAFAANRGNPRAAVFSAFRDGGYDPRGEHGAWMLETVAENAVQAAYQHGFASGLTRPEVWAELRGIGYVATLDDRTSEWCHAYHDVRLPVNHSWLLTHWAGTHHRCRGVMLPIFHDFTATPDSDLPYAPPPQPGFGVAPLFFGGHVFSHARAA